MPITDYKKTIIYKIVCNDLNVTDCYVGHTINMTKRKYQHKHACNKEYNKEYNLKIYQIIRENGGWDNWTMVLVETFPCKDKHEACRREREVFEELDAKMNTLRPYRTQEDIKEYHKKYQKKYYHEKYKEEKKQYYQEHKEEHKEEHKKYCEEYYQEHKEDLKQNQKKYREEHEEEIKKYLKQYREKNKEKIAEKMKEKIECEFCSKLLQKCSMSRHLKICKSKPKEDK